MGFFWDVVKDIAKTVVNVQTVGAFDTPTFEHDTRDVGTTNKTRPSAVPAPPQSSFTKKKDVRTVAGKELGESLVNACQMRDIQSVVQLLKEGADPNYIRSSVFGSENSLYFTWGRRDLLQLLLEHGADPNVRLQNSTGLPFEVACAEGDVQTAMLLMRFGAEVNSKDSDGWTPLMFAVGDTNGTGPSLTLVKELLSRGADPNASDNEGWSVLMNASKFGGLEVIELLLKYKANPNARDRNGDTPLTLAAKFGHQRAVGLLRAAGAH